MPKYEYFLEKNGIARKRLRPREHPGYDDGRRATSDQAPEEGPRSLPAGGNYGGELSSGMRARSSSVTTRGDAYGGVIPPFGISSIPPMGSSLGGQMPIVGGSMGSRGDRIPMGSSPAPTSFLSDVRNTLVFGPGGPELVPIPDFDADSTSNSVGYGSGGSPPSGNGTRGLMPIQGGSMRSGYGPPSGSGQRGELPGSIYTGSRPPIETANAGSPPLAGGYLESRSRPPLGIGSGLRGTRQEEYGTRPRTAQEPHSGRSGTSHTRSSSDDDESIAASERGIGDMGRSVVHGMVTDLEMKRREAITKWKSRH